MTLDNMWAWAWLLFWGGSALGLLIFTLVTSSGVRLEEEGEEDEMIEINGRVVFTEAELRCKGTGQLRLAPSFADKLREIREAMGEAMVVNSCCRAPSHNRAVGGHPRSLHLTEGGRETQGCCAIDIGTRGQRPEYRAKLVRLALERGWSVGVHSGFIHLDLRTDLAGLQQNVFNY